MLEHRPRQACLALLVLILVAPTLGSCLDEKAIAEAAAVETKRLVTVRENFPEPSALAEMPCPATVSDDGKAVEVARIEWDDLLTFGGQQPHPKSWRFVTSSEIKTFEAKASDYYYLKKAKYVVVFRAETKSYPKTTSDDTFESGVYDGWAVLFDLSSGARLCQAKVAIRNSDDVEHHTRGLREKSGEDAIFEDFVAQFSRQADAAVRRVAPHASIGEMYLAADERQ